MMVLLMGWRSVVEDDPTTGLSKMPLDESNVVLDDTRDEITTELDVVVEVVSVPELETVEGVVSVRCKLSKMVLI